MDIMTEMLPTLPDEIWQNHIFSYLWEDDLTKARRVCKDWWYLINCDHLWKPFVERHGIREDTLLLEKDVDDGQKLMSCKWFRIFSTYFNGLDRSWKGGEIIETPCPGLVEGVAIRMPYMFRSYDSFNIVEILRMRNGNFETVSRLRIPGDSVVLKISVKMLTQDLLAVWKGCLYFFYRRVGDVFETSEVFRFVGGNTPQLQACSDVERIDEFANRPAGQFFDGTSLFYMDTVNNKTIWFSDLLESKLFVCDRLESKVIKVIDLWQADVLKDWTVLIGDYVCCCAVATDRPEIRAYSSDGRLLLWQKQIDSSGDSRFVLDDFGCAAFSPSLDCCAFFFRFKTRHEIRLDIKSVWDMKLDSRTDLAYCISVDRGASVISCLSLSSGNRMWSTFTPTSLVTYPTGIVELLSTKHMCFCVLTNGKTGDHIGQIYSASDGSSVRSFNFHRKDLTFFTSSALVLKEWVPRGGTARQEFTLLNFLAPGRSETNFG